jgi:hypothetical protein
MNMRIRALLVAACLAAGPAAADGPATLQPVESFARVMKLEDLIHGTVTYRVDFCSEGDCDMFLADPDHLSALKDFSVLFASTDKDYVATLKAPPDSSVVAAILANGTKKYGCQADPNETRCVMHGLYQAGKLKRYSYLTKDGYFYEEVDEDGKYIPGGYD